MNFFTKLVKQNRCSLILAMGSLMAPSISPASELYAQLSLSPVQCVAMRQGNECYVDAVLSWKVDQAGEYCLFSSQQTAPLSCWVGKRNGQYTQEFITRENIVFRLMPKNTNTVLDEKQLEVAWVYKKTSRTNLSWRMF